VGRVGEGSVAAGQRGVGHVREAEVVQGRHRVCQLRRATPAVSASAAGQGRRRFRRCSRIHRGEGAASWRYPRIRHRAGAAPAVVVPAGHRSAARQASVRRGDRHRIKQALLQSRVGAAPEVPSYMDGVTGRD
jgi:hypothetical protein